MAAAASGRRVLVLSTDPASSLRDAFQLSRPRVPGRPQRVATTRGLLHVHDIDATRALDGWLSARRDALERIALRGTWLDEEDVSRLLRLSLPGIDEIAALFEIARIGGEGRYDLVVVDTAPTGHTLRMLAMPGTLLALARVFDHMQAKHRVMVEALRGGWTPDAEDALIEELAREGETLAALLRDGARTRFDWVSLAEPMAVEETADAAARLAEAAIPLAGVIVNRVTPAPPSRCGRCDARRAVEALAVAELRTRFADLVLVPDRPREPRSLRDLAALWRQVLPAATFQGLAPARRTSKRWEAEPDGRIVPAKPLAAGASLVLFGGKGGTGKTTCAAAAAIEAASRRRDRRVLLLSVDPAHSLADVLGTPIGDTARAIRGGPPNMFVRELDAARQFAAIRERYTAAIDAVFDRLLRGAGAIDISRDRVVMQDLIDLAPPGIDELVAVIDVLDALDEPAPAGFDLVVIDTAPTGHALRLLETPAVVQEWTRALMSILLKYQPVVGIGELGAILLKMSQGLGRLRERLTDRTRTRFIAVTRAAALPRAETARLVARLRSMHVEVPAVIVNARGRGTCATCRSAAAVERRELAALRRDLPSRSPAIVSAPAQFPPPHGPADLVRWAGRWRVGGISSDD